MLCVSLVPSKNLPQEIGRAGRDGLPATCKVMVCPDDLNVLEDYACGRGFFVDTLLHFPHLREGLLVTK